MAPLVHLSLYLCKVREGGRKKGKGRKDGWMDGWMDGLEGGRRGERKEEEGVLVGLLHKATIRDVPMVTKSCRSAGHYCRQLFECF